MSQPLENLQLLYHIFPFRQVFLNAILPEPCYNKCQKNSQKPPPRMREKNTGKESMGSPLSIQMKALSKKNLIVGQSGGPTAVINSSLYGVVSEGLLQDSVDRVYGMVNGIEGFLAGRVLDFQEVFSGNDLEKLKTTPGAYLGSCRYKLPEDLDDPVYPRLFQKFEELGIGYFFYIGGNDSMDTVSKLSRYAEKINSPVRVIGEPKTIDNDLVLTDHTPGFGSAARYVASTVREIVTDANVYETRSVTIVEIMGRHAGWLTAAGALARKYTGDNPLLIYLPETAFDQEAFLLKIQECFEKNPNVIVCVSEGIHDEKGTFICEYDNSVGTDTFGHKMLAGCGKYLENLVRNRLGVKARFRRTECKPALFRFYDLSHRPAGSCIRRTVRSPQRSERRDGKNGILCERYQHSIPNASGS